VNNVDFRHSRFLDPTSFVSGGVTEVQATQ
jgi:hypothetical protein